MSKRDTADTMNKWKWTAQLSFKLLLGHLREWTLIVVKDSQFQFKWLKGEALELFDNSSCLKKVFEILFEKCQTLQMTAEDSTTKMLCAEKYKMIFKQNGEKQNKAQ